MPIIAPIKAKKAELLEQQPLKTNYNNEFLSGMMTNPELIRNVAVVGHLHHGKTLVRHSYLCFIAHLIHFVHPACIQSTASELQNRKQHNFQTSLLLRGNCRHAVSALAALLALSTQPGVHV